jgi:hypothetical protein
MQVDAESMRMGSFRSRMRRVKGQEVQKFKGSRVQRFKSSDSKIKELLW